MSIPNELKYTSDHEWVKMEGSDFVIGITDHAQDALGDVVFIELPEPGQQISSGDEAAVVESVKAASDIYAPISGVVTAINTALEDAPEKVNQDPYGDGWFFKLQPGDAREVEGLLDAQAYQDICDADEH